MRKTTYAAGALSLAAALAFATPAQAGGWHHDDDPAKLSVLHGVPGLTVDVWVEGKLTLDDFTPGTLAGPLELDAGDYEIAITAWNATSADNPVIGPVNVELDEKMGVKIVEESVERVVATMPVEGNRQSFGLLHGGASLAVGEAVGSWAAVIHASTMGKTAVGVDVSATHHKSAREGQITITATPIHLGGTLTTHEVLLTNEAGQRLCTLRITNLLMDRKN
jgi:uncharacterized protein (TIGR00369 family)